MFHLHTNSCFLVYLLLEFLPTDFLKLWIKGKIAYFYKYINVVFYLIWGLLSAFFSRLVQLSSKCLPVAIILFLQIGSKSPRKSKLMS